MTVRAMLLTHLLTSTFQTSERKWSDIVSFHENVKSSNPMASSKSGHKVPRV
jgi:hypothetical protein